MAKCIAFKMKDVNEAFAHMDYELVCNYGDYANGHYLHTWDDGERLLVKCRNCGGYALIQRSEFHNFSGCDSYYTDYFPVDSETKAKEYNQKYDGYDLENEFKGKYMVKDNGRIGWMKG